MDWEPLEIVTPTDAEALERLDALYAAGELVTPEATVVPDTLPVVPVPSQAAHLTYRERLAYLLDWDESQHPRDESGRFGENSTESAASEGAPKGKDLGPQVLRQYPRAGSVGAQDIDKHLATHGLADSATLSQALVGQIPYDTGRLEVDATKDEIYVDGTLERADGRMQFKAEIKDNVARVTNVESYGSFRTTADSLTVLKNLTELGEKAGVDTIEMKANLDMGGYAWARMGFEATEPHYMAEAVDRNITRLRWGDPAHPETSKVAQSWSKDDVASLRALLAEQKGNPKLPELLSTMRVNGQNVGRVLLRGTDWQGKLNMKDPKAVSRFKRFLR